MKYKRFLFLLRVLRFDDIGTPDDRRKSDNLSPISQVIRDIRLDRYDTVRFRKFKARNFDIQVEPRSGRPVEVDCEQLKQIIDQDRNVSAPTIALELDVYQKTIVNALKRTNVTFKFNCRVPHELTAKVKSKRKAACLALLRDQRKRKSGQNCDL
ncbi:hypothetical protein AVEN_217231-1 [Araneus ventricosus]|uniref:Histone-lysine N-methyltransferase SETMAR n=1 Tax=Araneus ventricosus TaxID=182803 RepID=A0A4Y2SQT2_ARAVE|nr:hypothetical protein AVEN_217231-1 [Araneus ventricosus]